MTGQVKEDILCRFERMRGRDVLWQPGTDHAGIATQLVVTKQLSDRNINYRDLGREQFLEEVWKWKAQSGGTIVNQLKRLGALEAGLLAIDQERSDPRPTAAGLGLRI